MGVKNVMSRGVLWGGLYGAFVVAAVLLRQQLMLSGMSEVWGWDYRTFVSQMGDWRWIGYFGFRHPGLGLVMSPLVALEHVWSGAYLVVMPAVATATARMIWRMAGWIGLGVWLAFPTTWILAGVPESFPIAQLALIGSCYWLLNGKCVAARWGQRALPLVSCAFSVLNTMITLTNGVKPVLGWVALHWREMNRKVITRSAMVVFGAVFLGIGFFYLRTIMTGRGMGSGIEATLSWIPAERNLLRELYGFFVRPVGVCQSFIVYPLALWGLFRIIRARQMALILMLMSYFAVDVLIHCVIGWGMTEPWVFAPHWIWMLPLVIGRGMGYEDCSCL